MRKNGFLAGVCTTLLVLALGTSALAASGKVSFNFANVSLNGETKITAGSDITVANGEKVPGSILYTDAKGGKTNYLPIRAISELLGVDIDYDGATRTVELHTAKWERTEEGRSVTYTSQGDDREYDAPPAWRPTWTGDGWYLTQLYTSASGAKWTYMNPERDYIDFSCAYPTGASYGVEFLTADAIKNRQSVAIFGCQADYYTDGERQLLAWEDADGLLFQVSGLRCEKSELMAAAESIQRRSQTPKTLKLGWKPDNTSLFLAYAAADTVEELWSRNNIAITFTYSVSPIAAPAGTARSVSVNGAKASFYPAQEAYRGSSGTTTVNGVPVTGSDLGNGVSADTFTIPAQKELGTLLWRDEASGLYCRVQSILDQETLLRMAESVK